MELFERRRYYFCKFCGTFHFIDTPAEDGIRVLERRDGMPACPLCSSPLAKSLLDDDYVIEHCERCRGVLIGRSSFSDAIGRRRARESGPPAPALPLDQRELSRRVSCPSCRELMEVHPYYGPGNVVIDTCSRCDLIWLDHGELKQITDAGGRDRGRRMREEEWQPVMPPAARLSFGGRQFLGARQRFSLADLFDDDDD